MSDSDKRYIVTIGYNSGNMTQHRVKNFSWSINNKVTWECDPNEKFPEIILHFKLNAVEYVVSYEDK